MSPTAGRGSQDDPLRMRELLQRASQLAQEHELRSVVVGLAADEGDLIFPEILAYVSSALRIDDGIFRMTRERAVLLLTDTDRETAGRVVQRALSGFRETFATTQDPRVWCGFFEVTPETPGVRVKDVLPALFSEAPSN